MTPGAGENYLLQLLGESPAEQISDQGADNDGEGVDDGGYHAAEYNQPDHKLQRA
jgi:hypothetical protein